MILRAVVFRALSMKARALASQVMPSAKARHASGDMVNMRDWIKQGWKSSGIGLPALGPVRLPFKCGLAPEAPGSAAWCQSCHDLEAKNFALVSSGKAHELRRPRDGDRDPVCRREVLVTSATGIRDERHATQSPDNLHGAPEVFSTSP